MLSLVVNTTGLRYGISAATPWRRSAAARVERSAECLASRGPVERRGGGPLPVDQSLHTISRGSARAGGAGRRRARGAASTVELSSNRGRAGVFIGGRCRDLLFPGPYGQVFPRTGGNTLARCARSLANPSCSPTMLAQCWPTGPPYCSPCYLPTYGLLSIPR